MLIIKMTLCHLLSIHYEFEFYNLKYLLSFKLNLTIYGKKKSNYTLIFIVRLKLIFYLSIPAILFSKGLYNSFLSFSGYLSAILSKINFPP